jgi:hypothetical protein
MSEIASFCQNNTNDFRRQGRSPLKYTNSGGYTCLRKKKICAIEESLDFHSHLGQTLLHQSNS